MRLRIAAAAAALLVAAGLAIVLASGGDAGTESASGSALAWEEPPVAIDPGDLPNDHIAVGRVRNTSLGKISASNADFEVRDADGRRVDATVQFLSSFAHSLYGAYQQPTPLPDDELTRLGRKVTINAGETAPLTVSYRLAKGEKLPATLYYRGLAALDLPRDSDG
jgi:hypothetical protein